MSSCSDSGDDSSDAEQPPSLSLGRVFATPSHDEEQSPEEGELENDVDDETMSGENKAY